MRELLPKIVKAAWARDELLVLVLLQQAKQELDKQ